MNYSASNPPLPDAAASANSASADAAVAPAAAPAAAPETARDAAPDAARDAAPDAARDTAPDAAPDADHAKSAPPAPPNASRLEISIYQLAGEETFRRNRIDGTGWDWGWADWRREWMDQTPSKFAYRCLPLTIANQTGWWVYNPVGFTAYWAGRPEPRSVQFIFDSDPNLWSAWINDQFGEGVITWNTPILFRTRPEGSRLLVCGPINYFKDGLQPLTALIESDWMSMSFTMNWKITAANTALRFDLGEPLFQVIPLASNICTDLETASVRYMQLADDPEVARAYQQWQEARSNFHQQKRLGQVKPDDWQKDYFRGRDMLGREVTSGHKTKVTPPRIDYR